MTVWRAVGLGLCAVLVALAAWTGRETPSPVQAAEPAAVAPSPAAGTGPLGVLRAWDRRRAAAWAAGDAERLRRLYVPGSRAGRSDVRLLGEYAARGVRVRRLTTQVFAVDVVGAAPGRWRLRVVDRVAGGELVEDGRVRALRSGPVVTRRVELVRRGDGWRVGGRVS
ncbi:hypothetical protein ASG49_05775 [Marmoricola sp. Leaf446]|uniref:hypothetical protein n=1 Tax=Marmoricola sp. Leaf446 TaxID=1736379 RepID=UPI0006F88FC1|nr:hypothetical protein [Marmoricola sp. Leaf446]KQT94388.1 hypothetical protein ASG49_05775 [Marmoricola sp. Leaf446]